ncbi:hypothetical protein KAS50_06385, partial [bacterium]|nr:hypothetical protein [bacterium]
MSALHQQASEESLIPIKPGVPKKSPFWNQHSIRFIYAPAFDFKKMKEASYYLFTARSYANNRSYTFKDEVPWASLSPIWKELPAGQVLLKVEGCNDKGKVLGAVDVRLFNRGAVFTGLYHKPVLDYIESARRALKYLYELEHIKKWENGKKPDFSYGYYRYASKIIGAVVNSMVMYSKISKPEDISNALSIA